MKCIITEKRIKGPRVTDYDQRIAALTDQGPLKAQKPVRYQNLETGEEYLCLCGGFAWPGSKPGFAVVLAVQQPEGKNHMFRILEEVEEKNIQALLQSSFDLFLKYGQQCTVIPWQWYGDPESGFSQLFFKFNKHLKKTGHDYWFYLTQPPHFEVSNRFEIYCRIIYSLLQGGEKRLFLGSCKRLQGYLTQLNDEAVYRGTAEDYPAVGALGYALSAVYQYEPWQRNVEVTKEDRGNYEAYAVKEQEQAFRALGLGDYHFGDQEQLDDGTLASTVHDGAFAPSR